MFENIKFGWLLPSVDFPIFQCERPVHRIWNSSLFTQKLIDLMYITTLNVKFTVKIEQTILHLAIVVLICLNLAGFCDKSANKVDSKASKSLIFLHLIQ